MNKLASDWVLWQIGAEDSEVKSWEDTLEDVGEVSTIPEFLFMADEIVKVGVDNLCTLNLFKKGIKPMWEDKANSDGGRLIVDIQQMSRVDINDIWKRTMAFCISNEVEGICGCIFNDKPPHYKISIWIEKQDNHEYILRKWQEHLKLSKGNWYFFLHKRSMEPSRYKKKPSYKGKL